MFDFPLKAKRILIIGHPGSGKTTLAQQISKSRDIPHIEVDSLFWQKHWQAKSKSELIQDLSSFVEEDAWIIEGHINKVGALVLSKADTVIWLDTSFASCLWRVTQRSLTLLWTREKIWNENRLNFHRVFFSHQSPIWQLILNYRKRSQLFKSLDLGDKLTKIVGFRAGN